MLVLALDPGPVRTAWVKLSPELSVGVVEKGHDVNSAILDLIDVHVGPVVSETIEAMGMAVGEEVLNTAIWVGRFWERAASSESGMFHPIRRSQVKRHLCGQARAKDPNIRQALIDLYGPGRDMAMGTKRAPGPLYGVSNHCWSALAVGVTWLAQTQEGEGWPRVLRLRAAG